MVEMNLFLRLPAALCASDYSCQLASSVQTRRTWLSLAFALVMPLGCAPNASQNVQERAADSLNGVPEYVWRAPETRSIAGAPFSDSEDITQPARMAILGRYLLVLDAAAPKSINVFELSSGRRTDRLEARSRRAEDVGGFWAIDVSRGQNERFSVLDLAGQTITEYSLDQSTGRVQKETKALRVSAGGIVTEALALSSRQFLAFGHFERQGWALLDSLGRLVAPVGGEPPGEASTPPKVRAHAYQAHIVGSRRDGPFAVAYRNAARLSIVGPRGNVLASARTPVSYEPQFKVATRGGRPALLIDRQHNRLGYVDVAGTHTRIYALFSGRLVREFGSRADLARQVHVLDWEGRFIASWILDASVQAIAVDSSGSSLYAARMDPYPAILRYHIANDSLLLRTAGQSASTNQDRR